jgi:predicted dehydrogenase
MSTSVSARPRLGFAGVGWIGLNRLERIAAAGDAEIACIADPMPDAARKAAALVSERAGKGGAARAASRVQVVDGFEELLSAELDGIVIATPSGMHAEQASAALDRGLAVFCQKPLARTAEEALPVVEAARRRNRLLAVDFCYRTVAGVPQLAALVRSGALGEVYSIDLTFHNAYGPDKPWFYDPAQSGGGCVMDLGIHLVDLLLWVLGGPQVSGVTSRLHAGGKRIEPGASGAAGAHRAPLEDHALAQIELASGATARLACSWRLPAGCDAVIEAAFYGTRGAAVLRNVEGSFYDFVVEHCEGTRRHVLAAPPDDWGGRAACEWARRLATDASFDAEALRLIEVSRVVDAIYGR